MSYTNPANEKSRNSTLLETETIGVIPTDQRSGRPRDLFFVWFGAQMFLITVVTGGLSTTVFGLSFGWAMLAMIAGVIVGGLFMALHSAQGANLGVPQMIQSRGQFGSYGTFVIVVIVTITFMGWFAANLATAGAALQELVPSLRVEWGILILAITNILVAVFGYKMVHRATKLATYVLGSAFVIALGILIFGGDLSLQGLTAGSFSWGGFIGMFSVNVLWAIAYAPYVSDYSRYLPADTGPKAAFWATLGGLAIGTMIPMTLGALIGTAITGDNILGGLLEMTGWLGIVLLWAGVASSGLLNALNLYGATLCTITAIQTFRTKFIPGASGRVVIATVLGMAAALSAMLATDLMWFLLDIIYFMFFVLIPWTAVNLIDYYLLKHGKYDVNAFYASTGGIYGRWNATALTAYALGILVQVPFLVTTIYTGPLATWLGGIDLSWLIGLGVSSVYYFTVAKRQRLRGTQESKLGIGAEV